MGCSPSTDKLLLRRWPYFGAVKMAGGWLIPKDAEKPLDKRWKANKTTGGENI